MKFNRSQPNGLIRLVNRAGLVRCALIVMFALTMAWLPGPANAYAATPLDVSDLAMGQVGEGYAASEWEQNVLMTNDSSTTYDTRADKWTYALEGTYKDKFIVTNHGATTIGERKGYGSQFSIFSVKPVDGLTSGGSAKQYTASMIIYYDADGSGTTYEPVAVGFANISFTVQYNPVPVTQVEIVGVIPPQPGQAPTTTGIVCNTQSVKLDLSYPNTCWLYKPDGENEWYAYDKDTFQAGYPYALDVVAEAKPGYKFATNITATIDGISANVESVGAYDRRIRVEFGTLVTTIVNMDIGNIWTDLSPVYPVPFTTQFDRDGKLNEQMEFVEQYWYDNANDEKLYAGDLPKLGHTYNLDVTIKPKRGYVFDDKSFFNCFILEGRELSSSDYDRYNNPDGSVEIYFRNLSVTVAPADISKLKLSLPSYVYDGRTKSPKVVLFNDSGKQLATGDYSADVQAGKNVGRYMVTVKGQGNYTGQIVKYFSIDPKGRSISKLVRGKKSFTVKWSPLKTKMSKARVSGYQIRYALDSKFSKSVKSVNVKGYKSYKKTIKSLKKKKYYYVQLRTYMTVDCSKLYSKWSASKKVKTK